MEIPEIVPDVTEYILCRRRCRFCDTVTTAPLPEGVPQGMCGPRLSSLIVLLTGVYHLSRRNTAALLQDVLGVKLSLGSVSNVEGRMTAVLGAAHGEALSCVREVVPLPDPVLWLFVLVTGILVAAELVLVYGAFRALGRQWSVEARVLPVHELVTTGPYTHVRHPIYAGLMALMLATGLAFSRWPALLAAGAFGWLGTALRVRAEEALLRAAFGPAYDSYSSEVPALMPRWRSILLRSR